MARPLNPDSTHGAAVRVAKVRGFPRDYWLRVEKLLYDDWIGPDDLSKFDVPQYVRVAAENEQRLSNNFWNSIDPDRGKYRGGFQRNSRIKTLNALRAWWNDIPGDMLPPAARHLMLILLLDFANDKTMVAYPGLRKLATSTGMAINTVRKMLVVLESHGLIHHLDVKAKVLQTGRRASRGHAVSDGYRIQERCLWHAFTTDELDQAEPTPTKQRRQMDTSEPSSEPVGVHVSTIDTVTNTNEQHRTSTERVSISGQRVSTVDTPMYQSANCEPTPMSRYTCKEPSVLSHGSQEDSEDQDEAAGDVPAATGTSDDDGIDLADLAVLPVEPDALSASEEAYLDKLVADVKGRRQETAA